MSNRRRAREVAMQVLYQRDQNPDAPADYERRFIADELRFPAIEDFTLGLIEGVTKRLSDVDAALGAAAENWSVKRMAPVDRSILRLGTFEICFADGTPPRVAINEAVEIAKKFSTPEAPRFINGVLDRVARRHAGAEDDKPTAQPTGEQSAQPTAEPTAQPTDVAAAEAKPVSESNPAAEAPTVEASPTEPSPAEETVVPETSLNETEPDETKPDEPPRDP